MRLPPAVPNPDSPPARAPSPPHASPPRRCKNPSVTNPGHLYSLPFQPLPHNPPPPPPAPMLKCSRRGNYMSAIPTSLTEKQEHVLSLLTEGATYLQAAQQAGVHRNTI